MPQAFIHSFIRNFISYFELSEWCLFQKGKLCLVENVVRVLKRHIAHCFSYEFFFLQDVEIARRS